MAGGDEGKRGGEKRGRRGEGKYEGKRVRERRSCGGKRDEGNRLGKRKGNGEKG